MKNLYKIFLILICVLLKADLAFNSSPPKVMVVTSDRSISKYHMVANSFVNNFPFAVDVEDVGILSDKKVRQIREAIKSKNPELIYCIGSKALIAACKAFPNIPFVFSSTINWQRFDLPETGRGIAAEISVDMQITLFRFIFPSVKRVGVIYNPKFNKEWFEGAKQTADSLGVVLVGIEYNKSDSMDKIVQNLISKVDSLWLIPDPAVITRKSISLIFPYFENEKKPVFAYSDVFINEGAILTISVDDATIGRQAAVLALDILEGRQPMDKVQNPAGSFISLNLARANAYKLEVNRAALGSINRIIE